VETSRRKDRVTTKMDAGAIVEGEKLMWCMECNQHLTNCDCPDLQERLADLLSSKHLTCRMCTKCGKHYAVCECEDPEWAMSNGGDAQMKKTLETERATSRRYPFK